VSTYHPTEERVLVKKTYVDDVLSETVYYVDSNYVRVVNSSGSFDSLTDFLASLSQALN